MFLPAFVCLSVCLLARLLKNACMDLDEMLRVDRCRDMDELINFWAPDPDYSRDAGTGLLSPLSYKLSYAEFYVGKIPRILIGAARRCSDAWFYSSVTRRNNFVGGTCAPPSFFIRLVHTFFLIFALFLFCFLSSAIQWWTKMLLCRHELKQNAQYSLCQLTIG